MTRCSTPYECFCPEREVDGGSGDRVQCSADDCEEPGLLHDKCRERWVSLLKRTAMAKSTYFRHTDGNEYVLFKHEVVYECIRRYCRCPCGRGYLRLLLGPGKDSATPKKKKKTKTALLPTLNAKPPTKKIHKVSAIHHEPNKTKPTPNKEQTRPSQDRPVPSRNPTRSSSSSVSYSGCQLPPSHPTRSHPEPEEEGWISVVNGARPAKLNKKDNLDLYLLLQVYF